MSAANPLTVLNSQLTVVEHLFNVQTDYVAQYRFLRGQISNYSQFQLSKSAAVHAASVGITHDPLAPGGHPHALSKLVEDYVLRVIVPPLLRGKQYDVLFSKASKFQRLVQDAPPHLGYIPRLFNYIVTPADFRRYGRAPPPPIIGVPGTTCFVHDALHFATPDDLLHLFRSSPDLVTLYASIVIPPGLLLGNVAGRTAMYSYRVSGTSVLYAPDGQWHEHYSQPLSCKWLLTTQTLRSLDVTLSFTTLATHDSVHLLQITRGVTHHPSPTYVTIPLTSQLPLEPFPYLNNSTRLVNKPALDFLIGYAKGVKVKDADQLGARLRLWLGDHSEFQLSPGERDVIAHYTYAAVRASQHEHDSFLLLSKPHHFFTRAGPVRWARLLAQILSQKAVEDARSNLDPPPALFLCHTQELFSSSSTRSSFLSHGRLPDPTPARVRAAIHSILYPPDAPPRALPFDPLLGNGLSNSLTLRAVRSSLFLSSSYFLPHGLRFFFSTKSFILNMRVPRFFLTPSFLCLALAASPGVVLASDAIGALLYHTVTRTCDFVSTALARPIRSILYRGMSASLFLRRIDVALHQLLTPRDEHLLLESDPDLLFGLMAEAPEDSPLSHPSTDSPDSSAVPTPPSSGSSVPEGPLPDSFSPPEPSSHIPVPRNVRNPPPPPAASLWPSVSADPDDPEDPGAALSEGQTYSGAHVLVVELPHPVSFLGLLSWLRYTDAPSVNFRLRSGTWTDSEALPFVRSHPSLTSSLHNPALTVSWKTRVPVSRYRFAPTTPLPPNVDLPNLPPPAGLDHSDHHFVFLSPDTDVSDLLPWLEQCPDSAFTVTGFDLSPTSFSRLPSHVRYAQVGAGARLWCTDPQLSRADPLVGSGQALSIPEPPPIGRDTCLLDAFSAAGPIPRTDVWRVLVYHLGVPRATTYSRSPFPLGTPEVDALARSFSRAVMVHASGSIHKFGPLSGPPLVLYHQRHHWSAVPARSTRGSVPTTSPGGAMCYLPLPDKLALLCRSFSQQFRLSSKRADQTVKQFSSGTLGVLIRRDQPLLDKWRSLCDSPPAAARRSVRLAGVLGDPGTGKTYQFSLVIADHWRAHPEHNPITVIVPTTDLREALMSSLRPPPGHGYRVKTWENSLIQPVADTVLFDDVGLLPPILDLFLLVHPNVKRVFFTGDPAQGLFELDSASPFRAVSRPALAQMTSAACSYKRSGFRLACGVAPNLASETVSQLPGSIRFVANSVGPLVVSTQGAVQSYSQLGRSAFTPIGCQGRTIRGPYTLLVDKFLNHASDAAVYTALTRGTGDVLVTIPDLRSKGFTPSGCPILRALMTAGSLDDWQPLYECVRDHKLRHTPPQLSDPLRQPGVSPPDLSSLLNYPLPGTGFGDFIQSTLDFILRPLVLLVSPSRWYVSKHDYNSETMDAALECVPHLSLHYATAPGASRPPDFVFEGHKITGNVASFPFTLMDDFQLHTPRELLLRPSAASDIMESLYPNACIYDREHRHGNAYTAQINTEDYATAVFLQHRRKDPVTEAWTFKERYVPPKRPSTTYLGGGHALFEAYYHTYAPEIPPFNQAVYEQCEEEDQAALLEKGPKCLVNISYRNDPSLDPHKAETFLKSQDVTKLGTEFRLAKKGQMITGFAAAVNSRFGPLARYLYRATRTSLPPEILLLNGVTLEEQEAWFAEHWDWSAACYEDDYTGFDGTQNEDFLTFQTLYMHAFGVPEDLVADYLAWVTHLSCMLGPLGIAIASGFKPTWFFNTIDSMAYQALKHDLAPHRSGTKPVARAYSGDDTLHNEQIHVRPGFSRLAHKFLLVSTGSHTAAPHFCGTLNTPSGSFADPELLLLRCLYKLRSGRIFQSSLGYAEHCYRLQRNFELTLPHLSSRQVACHSLTLRLLRLVLRIQGLPLIGEFLTKLLPHFYNLSGIVDDAFLP